MRYCLNQFARVFVSQEELRSVEQDVLLEFILDGVRKKEHARGS
jgi:hypothetical protein